MNLTDIREIEALLTRHGFHFSKTLGQNFLIAPWVPERIARAAVPDGETQVGVVEIGPGVGCLTEQLALRAEKVLSLELDETLRPVLAETLSGRDNVEIVFGDARKVDFSAIVEEKQPGLRHVFCANLPYNVTTPILTALVESGCFEKIVVMIQKEAARRLCAAAGTEDYSVLSVLAQWRAELQVLFDVPADCFLPRPKVTSSVIELRRRAVPLVADTDEKLLFRVVRAAFAQRRKTLSNALSSTFGTAGREAVAEALDAFGMDARTRGEALGAGQFALLTKALAKRL